MDVDFLNQYLSKNVDLLMAMGTAALEGGKLGIPTILLDASYEQIPNGYQFKWLFESDGSNVAQFIHSKNFENNGHSLDNIIESININPKRIGAKCLLYVDKNHSVKAISNQLIKGVKKATFKWGDINPKLIEKNPIRKINDLIKHKF